MHRKGQWHDGHEEMTKRIYEKQRERNSRAKQAVCVYAERQMVFYNRSFMASGKETERLFMPSCKCFISVLCIVQR